MSSEKSFIFSKKGKEQYRMRKSTFSKKSIKSREEERNFNIFP